MTWYDRAGNMIPGPLKDFSRVARDVLPDGKVVSTIHLGLNHSYEGGPPLIFESMVFPSEGDYMDLQCERYSTEDDAIIGHNHLVRKYTATLPKSEADK